MLSILLTTRPSVLQSNCMSTHTYTIHLEPEPEGGFTVTVPALPGCVTWGEDYDHALRMAQECVEGFLEALVKADQPIPEESIAAPVDTLIQVKLPAGV